MIGLTSVTSFIKGLRIQWLDHILRREENDPLKIAYQWKLQRKRPRGSPRKRWIDRVIEDLNPMGIENWHEIMQDREK